ncbi:MAG: alpha/beta fold hydrolase [Prochlorothrix sp.]
MWRGWQVRYRVVLPAQVQSSWPPLLCLHGFGASGQHWRHNLGVWGQHTPTYALDLLGFGASEKAAAPYNPAFWGELGADFCQEFIGQPCVLVGNSLGSVVTMTVAQQRPQWVRGLVWVNLPDNSLVLPSIPAAIDRWIRPLQRWSQPLSRGLQWAGTGPWVINPILAVVRSPRLLYPALASAYGDKNAVDGELRSLVRDPAHDRHAAQALRFITRGMGQIPASLRAKRVVPQLQVPILLLWGQCDRLVPPALGPACAALNPRIRLVEVAGAGHCLQDECPDRVNAWVLEWVQTQVMGQTIRVETPNEVSQPLADSP